MTSEALDLLDRLSNPELAERAEQEADRPYGRFPGRWFKADIPQQELDIVSRRPNNSQFDEWGLYLTVNVTEVYNASPPIEPGEYQLWIRSANPTTRDGKENKRTKHSELIQMVEAAGRGPRTWTNTKGVVFKEEIHNYTADRNTGQKGSDGKDIWERNVPQRPVFYYKLDFSGNVITNNTFSQNGSGSTAQPTEPSPEAITAAFAILGTDGMEEAAFGLACSKDPVCKQDMAFIDYVASGKFASDQIAAGKIVRDGSNLVVVS